MAESGVNYIYKYALDISTQLLDMVISTASENNLCRFSLNDYSSGFKMLRVWDELDCRLSYYLGIGSVSAALALGETAALGAITAGLALPLMFILSFSTILMGILLIMFFIFLLSTMIYIVETFAACAFLILLLIVFAPIFVPMVLFEYTKQSFMSWWRLILGFTLQPMIIGVYIALMLPIMDSIIFPGCIFSKWTVNNVPVIGASSSSNTGAIFSKTTAEAIPSSSGYSPITLNGQISSSTDQYGSINVDQSSSTKTRYGDLGIGNMITKTVDFPVLIDEDQTQECKSSWGYKIAIVKNKYNHIKTGSPSEFADSMLFPIKSLADKDQWLSLLSAVLQFTLFSVLFYNFAGLVGGIAGDITGSIDISSLTSGPNALTDKAIGLISKAVKRQLPGGAKSLHAAKKEGNNPTGDKDKEGKDDDHDKKDADKDLTSGDKKDGNEQGAQNSGGANEASQGAQNSENIKVPRTGGVK
jgi:type IV secretory pathway VirB6-like protein